MAQKLSEIFQGKIIYDALLSQYTSFQLGGKCKGLILCQNPVELERAVGYFIQEHLEFILIGGGTNLVVSDQGVDCHVIRYVSETPLIERKGNELIVFASTKLDDLVVFALENNLEGINHCSGIPGTVGGAIVGNAGAFGKQIGDVTKSVTAITRQGVKKEIPAQGLQFSYRDSVLKKTGDIVLSVCLELRPSDKQDLQKEREEILALRQSKHPHLETEPCAGSFFRNVEPTSKAGKRQAAGWFLEEAGAQNLKVGGAVIFKKHANIIVKTHECTSEDVFNLHQQMKNMVKDRFGIELVREVRFVGEFEGKPKNLRDVMW